MIYGPDPHFALTEFDQAVPDRAVMGVAFVGSDGVVRVWLNNAIESRAQHEWVSRQFQEAAATALKMFQGGSA